MFLMFMFSVKVSAQAELDTPVTRKICVQMDEPDIILVNDIADQVPKLP